MCVLQLQAVKLKMFHLCFFITEQNLIFSLFKVYHDFSKVLFFKISAKCDDFRLLLFNKTLKQFIQVCLQFIFTSGFLILTEEINTNFWNKLGATVLLKKVFAAAELEMFQKKISASQNSVGGQTTQNRWGGQKEGHRKVLENISNYRPHADSFLKTPDLIW